MHYNYLFVLLFNNMANLKGEYKEFLDSFDSTNNAVFEFHGIIEEQYKSFSNFVLSSFELDNKTWSSVNHYFQAAKFFGTDDDWSEEIRNAETPFEASRMGKSRSHPIQSNWNERCVCYRLTVFFVCWVAIILFLVPFTELDMSPLLYSPSDSVFSEGMKNLDIQEKTAAIRQHV